MSCNPNAGKDPYHLSCTLEIKGDAECVKKAKELITKRFLGLGLQEEEIKIVVKGNTLECDISNFYSSPEDIDHCRNFFLFPEAFQIWETYENYEVLPKLSELNEKLAGRMDSAASANPSPADTSAAFSLAGGDPNANAETEKVQHPLFNILNPAINYANNTVAEGPEVGYFRKPDLEKVMEMLDMGKDSIFPSNMVFRWGPPGNQQDGRFALFALKSRDSLKPYAIDGSGIINAEVEINEDFGSAPSILYEYNESQSKRWFNVTSSNTGKYLAMVMDGEVIMAPKVQSPIEGGKCQISGLFTLDHANMIATFLKSDALGGQCRVIKYEYKQLK